MYSKLQRNVVLKCYYFFQTNFSVDLDSVYESNPNSSIYKLSTVDPLRRNKFILIIRFTSILPDREQYFTSPEFLIRSRRPTRATNVSKANITDENDEVVVERKPEESWRIEEKVKEG